MAIPKSIPSGPKLPSVVVKSEMVLAGDVADAPAPTDYDVEPTVSAPPTVPDERPEDEVIDPISDLVGIMVDKSQRFVMTKLGETAKAATDSVYRVGHNGI